MERMDQAPEAPELTPPSGDFDIQGAIDAMKQARLGEGQPTEGGTSKQAGEAPQQEPVYEIGGKKWTASELMEELKTAENARRAIAASTKRWQEASLKERELQEKLNDPRWKELEQLYETIESDPNAATLFDQILDYMSGRAPLPSFAGYGMSDPMVLQLQQQLREVRSEIQEIEQERNTVTAAQLADDFNSWVAEQRGEPMSEEELAQFVDDYVNNTPELHGYEDNLEYMKFHWWKTQGQGLEQAKVAQAKDQARQEVVQAIKTGQAVAASEVTPGPHKDVGYEPDMSRTDFGPEIEAAINSGILSNID